VVRDAELKKQLAAQSSFMWKLARGAEIKKQKQFVGRDKTNSAMDWSVEHFAEYKGWWVHNGKRIESDEWAAARAIRSGEVSLDEEVAIECFDGSRKIILNSAMPIRDEQGTIVGAIIVNHDITESKRLEAQLRALVERDPLTNAHNRRSLQAMLGHADKLGRLLYPTRSVLLFTILLSYVGRVGPYTIAVDKDLERLWRAPPA